MSVLKEHVNSPDSSGAKLHTPHTDARQCENALRSLSVTVAAVPSPAFALASSAAGPRVRARPLGGASPWRRW